MELYIPKRKLESTGEMMTVYREGSTVVEVAGDLKWVCCRIEQQSWFCKRAMETKNVELVRMKWATSMRKLITPN